MLLLRDDTSSGVEAVVHSSHSFNGGGDFSQEDGLLKAGLCGQLASIVKTSGGRNDLATSSMDGISMEHAIQDVHSDTAHVLFAESSFLGGPLPAGFHGLT